jgi:hypothetical protein
MYARAYCVETGTVLVRAMGDSNTAQADAIESKLPRARVLVAELLAGLSFENSATISKSWPS